MTDRRPFAVRLLAWFDQNRRDLPWRATRDPWAIWVSEVMLQQTRVAAVRSAYERFLRRFPTVASFAAASDDDLLLAWRGLGYYRRARLLREGARAVIAQHGGAVPADPAALGELPGVGDYTRGAIASIAFGFVTPAIDGNVERVVSRHRGVRENVK
ncbi:MAG: A/G-specific adenine glycosylase, partial [Planctomycetota bacterium]|nr:A/G-specific adenine glycosylase [Planctomycetota bacterium]